MMIARDAAIGGIGLAAVVAGAYLWHLDGRPTACETSAAGETACPRIYNTELIGVPLLFAGAIGAAAGTLLVVHDVHVRHLDVAFGPGTVAIWGQFR